MKSVQLGELAAQTRNLNPNTFPDEEFDLLSIPAFDSGNPERVLGAQIGSTKQMVAPGDVMISKIVPHIRRAWIVPDPADRRQLASGEWIVFRNTSVHPPFLRHVLLSERFHRKFLQTVAGVGGSLLRARPSHVFKIGIDMPEVGEQRRIADILDQADALRTKRREAIAHLDTLSQSIFHEMFGEEDYEVARLDEIADVTSGITKGRKVPADYALTEVPYMAVSNVQDMSLDMGIVKTIAVTGAEIVRYELEVDDLLMTEGGDPDKLGRGTLWTGEIERCLHQNHIYRVRLKPDTDVLPIYLNWTTSSGAARGYFLRCAKQTTGIASINKTQLSATPVPIPPMEQQQEFAIRVARIERLKFKQRAQLAELDALFASLQERAFKGQL